LSQKKNPQQKKERAAETCLLNYFINVHQTPLIYKNVGWLMGPREFLVWSATMKIVTILS
jgi:hypothetical protein